MKAAFLLLAPLLLLSACARRETAAPAAASGPKEYPLTGQVIVYSPEKGTVIVKHDEIPGYMPPMTMEFAFEPADRDKLAEGRSFRARLIDDGSGTLRLHAVEPLDPVKEAAVKAAANELRQDTSMRGKGAYREVGETVPRFTLYDQNGEVFSLDRVRGRWVVLNFIYTRCPIATMCPASTRNMAALQRLARARAVDKLELVSISLDPAYDTPAVLKQYADVRGIDGSNFHFLTGPDGAVRDLLVQFGVVVTPGENYLKHTLSTLLIDPSGRIAYRVDGTQWSPEDFLKRLPSARSD